MTAQEGNYVAWPFGFKGELKDVPFSAAGSIIEAIRYYGMLKLAVYNMQWVGMSTLSGSGSFAALKDSTAMWIVAYNAMMSGFARQLDSQLGKRLFEWNRAAFPNMTVRPKLVASPIEKIIDLGELGTFWSQIRSTMPVGDDDFISIRRKSGFLPESLPTKAEVRSQETGDPSLDTSKTNAEDALAGKPTAGDATTAEVDQAEAAAAAEMSAGAPVRELANTGAMVAFFPDKETAKALAIEGGEAASDLHLTLALLGEAATLDDERQARLFEVVRSFAILNPPVSGKITGSGTFDGGVTVALVDLPEFPAWRERLVAALQLNGFDVATEHGFIPHITLTYEAVEGVTVEPRDVTFESLTVVIGDTRKNFVLRGEENDLASLAATLDRTLAMLSAMASALPGVAAGGGGQ
jgi:2'-5' RNA ligase